jgi:hypothetical protein
VTLKNLDAKIRQFVAHFNTQVETIRTLQSGDGGGPRSRIELAIHKKILYLSILDSLAGIRYPEIRNNAERFCGFLAEHTGWEEGALVSVPVLEARLHPRALDRRLARCVLKLLKKHSTLVPNGMAAAKLDVELASLEAKASLPGGLAVIRESQHYKLLYLYRNFVVHEFREPGYAMEIFGESRTEPWYHSYINEPTWHLLYPLGFFERLATYSVSSIGMHFAEQSIDPYALVSDTTKWPKSIRGPVKEPSNSALLRPPTALSHGRHR